MKEIILSLLVIALVVGMVFAMSAMVDPRNSAAADATRIQAEQTARDAEQARAQKQAEWELQQEQRRQVNQQWIDAWKVFIPVAMALLTFGVSVVIFSFSLFTSISLWNATTAIKIYSINRASQIRLDPATGQFPAFAPPGKNMLLDVNTGIAMSTDQVRDPDHTLAMGASGIRLSGVVSRNEASRPLGQTVITNPEKPRIDFNYPKKPAPETVDIEQSPPPV